MGDGPYHIALTAAFTKSLAMQEVFLLPNDKTASFYLAPALRSLCEDLIVLGFINKHLSEDADVVIRLLLDLDFQTTLHAQEAFFNQFRPYQPTIKPKLPKSEIKKIKSKLKKLHLSFISETDSFTPSVRQMAKSQGLLMLYDYLYNATSRLVHFSPGNLFRMCWGNPNGEMTCEINALEKYYQKFIEFYATHLLCTLAHQFQTQLRISSEVQSFLNDRLTKVNQLTRWPELITFEELNAKNPWDEPNAMHKMGFWKILIKNPGLIFTPIE